MFAQRMLSQPLYLAFNYLPESAHFLGHSARQGLLNDRTDCFLFIFVFGISTPVLLVV